MGRSDRSRKADMTDALKIAIRGTVEAAHQQTDPQALALTTSKAIATLHAGVEELSNLRREAVLALTAQGWTHDRIARLLGVQRPVVTRMLARPGTPVERQFLGGPNLVVAIGGKLETGRKAGGDQPMLSTTALAAYEILADMARSVGLEPHVQVVPPPGHVNLNQANLVVLTSPKLLPFVGQVVAADPWYGFAADDDGWYLVERTTGTEHRSPFDQGEHADYAYLGRLPRPDHKGTFLYLAGIHAPGTLAAARYLAANLPELHRTYRRRRFSMLLTCTYNGDEITSVDVLAPARLHEGAT